MPRSRRAVALAVAVLLFGVAAIVYAAVVHKGKTHPGAVSPPGVTSGTLPSSAAVNRTPIAGLAPDQFGISTGQQLFTETGDKIDADMAGIATLPAHWVRTAVRWDSVEPDGPTSDDWAQADRIVAAAQKNKIELIIDLTGTPPWARAPGAGPVQFPPDLQTYATFAGKLAARYKGRVAAYELGNEPNHLKSFANPSEAPRLYAQLLKLSYPAIKAADPAAKVLTAGVGGTTGNGVVGGDEFVADLYAAGAKPYFDGVAYHPYTYPLLPSDDHGARGWNRMLKARDTMVSNGDGDKQIWVTEYGAPTDGPNSVSEDQQAKIMYDAFRLWATYPWAGPLCWFDYRDKGTDTSDHGNFFGLYTKDGQPKVALQQYETLARAAR
jgi:hypothetical protein